MMKALNYYPDSCIVQRPTGQLDPETGDELFDLIYDGACGLQHRDGGGTYRQGYSYQSYPIVIIEDTTTLFRINDKVVITTDNGRVIEGTIEQYETISPEEDDVLSGTTIWLKGGTDVIDNENG